ncbi:MULTISPECIES: ABC transporter ATP-binding protein [unclassified Haematobacter]|uniref:ABC transporter ATP-binding protein n=1 Tax=unclassified Haematobacter TaxID=2640585 RepID=UPI0025BA6B8A|nr:MULTISPECIES: ABC transporter ATP-binding protein [unclassified Haematobacter]
MADIVIDRIRKRFGATDALKEVSLTVRDGEFVSLLGPSGCGKTTLLRIVAGLETATSGDVRIGGRSVRGLEPKDRGLAMVFQNYAVFPHMTVRENVAFGLRMQKAEEARVTAQVARAAALLHIEPYLDRYPNKLSGGQRQRVAVARALAVEPAVLLMDEPLSNLDALLRLEMRTELKQVLAEAGTTTLYVTHDQTEAMGLSDRIAVMHDGVVEQIGSPVEIYDRPATRFVGGFIGNPPMNFLTLPVEGGAVALGGFRVAAPPGSGAAVTLGLRGEAVRRARAGEGLPMTVRVAEPMGSHLLLTGTIAGEPVRVSLPPGENIRPGEEIALAPDTARLVWLSPESGRSLSA